MNLRQLNGWQRLWIVVVVPWVVWAILKGWAEFPTYEKHLAFWAYSLEIQVRYAPPLDRTPAEEREVEKRVSAQRAELGDEQFIARISALYPKIDFSKTLELYRSASANQWQQQLGVVFAWFLAAVVPPGLLYALGLLVAWVRAGFRAPRAKD